MKIRSANDIVTAGISLTGGELLSLKYADTEMLWQGDPAFWHRRAPVLFPFCGRCENGAFSWRGRTYRMPIHGFLPDLAASGAEQPSPERAVLYFRDSPATREIWPFAFRLALCYAAKEDGLQVSAEVTAASADMPFSIGFHPGFRLPSPDLTGAFLLTGASPRLVGISPSGLFDGTFGTCPEWKSGRIDLTDPRISANGLFLSDCGRNVSLCVPGLSCQVTMDVGDFPFFGIWRAPGAPFVCLEPWHGLPAPDGRPTDLSEEAPGRTVLGAGSSVSFALGIRFVPK